MRRVKRFFKAPVDKCEPNEKNSSDIPNSPLSARHDSSESSLTILVRQIASCVESSSYGLREDIEKIYKDSYSAVEFLDGTLHNCTSFWDIVANLGAYATLDDNADWGSGPDDAPSMFNNAEDGYQSPYDPDDEIENEYQDHDDENEYQSSRADPDDQAEVEHQDSESLYYDEDIPEDEYGSPESLYYSDEEDGYQSSGSLHYLEDGAEEYQGIRYSGPLGYGRSWPVIEIGRRPESRTVVGNASGSWGVPKDIRARETSLGAIVKRLTLAFSDTAQYKRILKCKGLDAQTLLDIFQELLNKSNLSNSFRRNLIVAMQRLSKKTDLYPTCFELRNVQLDSQDPITGGGFADIYKGHLEKSQHVCLKLIRIYERSQVDYIVKKFSREAILWSQLSHKNILPFYGIYRFKSRLCLVSPWVFNGHVNQFLEHNPEANRVLLSLDVIEGMAYLHEQGIIHGDLKGANILVNSSGIACLADFGLSAVVDSQILAWTSHSAPLSNGGSMRWQAPELNNTDEITPNSESTDIYAWSCTCYELFTGQLPFYEIIRDATVVLKVRSGERPSQPDVTSPSRVKYGLTDTIWKLMEDCWKEDPADRPTAKQVKARLITEAVHDQRVFEGWEYVSPLHLRDTTNTSIDLEKMDKILNSL